jgi:hypothetical protein
LKLAPKILTELRCRDKSEGRLSLVSRNYFSVVTDRVVLTIDLATQGSKGGGIRFPDPPQA